MVVVSVFLLSGCLKFEFEEEGLKPVYLDPNDMSVIRKIDPIPFGDLGLIVRRGNLLMINEKLRGIHVLNNTNPSSPVPLCFIEIPGNSQFSYDGQYIYADNSIHLIIIKFNPQVDGIKVVSKIDNVYKQKGPSQNIIPPNDYRGYFECYNPSEGVFLRWEKAMLYEKTCKKK